jgi:hypothetical protein
MTIGPEDWEAQEPSPDFADRVMERVRAEAGSATPEPRRRVSLRAGVAGGLALAAAVTLAVGWRGTREPDHGDAVAVLERGAHVTWNGDDVNQPTGDVFYRVEPGGAFRVHTPSGDVQVLGTCFRVQVEAPEGQAKEESDQMNSRDLKVGAIGAALSAAAFVSVYEGKVALSHASERVTLTAGETARLGGSGSRGVEVTSGGHDDNEGARETDPLVAANANLVDSVSEYKRKLEALESQKAAIAKQLTEAQGKLALAQNDGQALPTKSPYDLTPDDWKEMAKEGKVVSRTPCASPAAWMPTPDQLAKDGLAPTDAQAIHDARAQSYGRVWGVIRPLCVQALQGDAKVADKLGPVTCSSLVSDVSRSNGEDTAEELRAVAEMRAGMRPYDPSALGSYGQILWEESGETQAMEQQLAQAIGPADAHAFVYGDEGCWSNSSNSVGPRPILPPK